MELGWGQELRSVHCTSLGLAEGMGDMTQQIPAPGAPSKPGLKSVASGKHLGE